MKKIIGFALMLLLLVGCKKELESPFINGNRSKITLNYPRDSRGFYLVTLDTGEFSRFNIYVEASEVKPYYQYNGTSVIEVNFDSDTYWIIDKALAVKVPLYSYRGLFTNPNFRRPLPVKNITVILEQYKNSIVPIVQETGIYLKKYFPGSLYQPADEYKPEDGMLWGKRIVGPVPRYMKGDTIKVYAQVFWEAGNYTWEYPDRTKKLDSVQIILK